MFNSVSCYLFTLSSDTKDFLFPAGPISFHLLLQLTVDAVQSRDLSTHTDQLAVQFLLWQPFMLLGLTLNCVLVSQRDMDNHSETHGQS